jgi:thymidylate synthase (FAD)
MNLVKQSHEIVSITSNPLKRIEECARTCYQSEGAIREGSDKDLVKKLIKRGHEAMLEFASMTVRFVTDRGVTHEAVRHRLCAFAQESTRYCNYAGRPMNFISTEWRYEDPEGDKIWESHMVACEQAYNKLISRGWTPQKARTVLPNSLKTEIVISANLREWRHIFKMRTSRAAHPQIVGLMRPLLLEVQNLIPIIFDDISGN